MSSRNPPLRPPDVQWDMLGGSRIQYRVSAITPVYGGSYEAGKVDAQRPIRPSAIRGCLRFWWRAARGAQYPSIGETRSAESRLFGSTAEPSPFDLSVEVTNTGGPDQAQGPAYALFPFRESKAPGLSGVAFSVSLATPRGAPEDLISELEAAVWAWVTFGGYGARTRRGCGALRCGDLPCPTDAGDLGRQAAQYVVPGPPPRGIPSLAGARVVLGGPFDEPVGAWKAAVDLYSQLRQGPGMGRNAGSDAKRPGRSRWPEADAIRRLSGQFAQAHRPEHPAGNSFPRADLGVPIIFHFKDSGDPRDHALQVQTDKPGRMASPVITRPLALADGKFAPMVVLLSAPHVWECQGADLKVNDHKLGQSEVQSDTIARATKPLSELGVADAREAVVALSEREWKTQAVKLP